MTRRLAGVPLIVLGGVLSVLSYLEWKRREDAIERGERLGRSVLPLILTVGVAAAAVVAVIAAAVTNAS